MIARKFTYFALYDGLSSFSSDKKIVDELLMVHASYSISIIDDYTAYCGAALSCGDPVDGIVNEFIEKLRSNEADFRARLSRELDGIDFRPLSEIEKINLLRAIRSKRKDKWEGVENYVLLEAADVLSATLRFVDDCAAALSTGDQLQPIYMAYIEKIEGRRG